MNNDQTNETEPVQEQTETKEERIDELDVIGGGLLKLVQNAFLKVKSIILPQKSE
jgi:hypothetical protein